MILIIRIILIAIIFPRQFLFRPHHVGRSKAEVAKDVVSQFNTTATIIAHYDNVKSNCYNLDYYRKFDIVLNALDNVDARRHVNRMCLASDRFEL